MRAVGIDLRLWPWPRKLHFVMGDGYSLPFSDECFDAVGSLTVLEHLAYPEEFLEEMIRVVRFKGRVVIGTPNMYGCVLLHPGDSLTHTGGIPRYAKNFVLHFKKHFESIFAPGSVCFDILEPDMTRVPLGASDYDAICATDPAVVRAVLKRCGVKVTHQSPSLEYPNSRLTATVTKALEVLPVVRDLFGGIFVVGEKVQANTRLRTKWKTSL